MFNVDDTIVAIATAPGASLRGVARVTGPHTIGLLRAVVKSDQLFANGRKGQPRVTTALVSAGELLGDVPCEVYWWPTTRSYTRQPTAEFHTFGSLPVLDAIVSKLCQAGARLARPGEFTLRAFLAGRLDLTQAEAVLGVIEARSQKELYVALQQLAGGLAGPLQELRNQLLDLLAHLEAGLDFVEEDIEFISARELVKQLDTVEHGIQKLLAQIGQRQELAIEPRVVLRGLPNVGKSSLFNALVGNERSLVAPTASTTRDYVSARVTFAGHSVLLVDTAGVETSTAATISEAAQRMGESQAQQAALELFCLDVSRASTDWEREQIADSVGPRRLIVLTKCDTTPHSARSFACIATSSRTGLGLTNLSCAIAERLDEVCDEESTVVGATAVRCTESLRLAAESVVRAKNVAEGLGGEELVAVELRIALDHLGMVVGAVYTDDILDRIFSRFCIGK